MTKKDYIKIAKLIKETKEYQDTGDYNGFDYLPLESFIDGLCEILKADNPLFNKDKFITACK